MAKGKRELEKATPIQVVDVAEEVKEVKEVEEVKEVKEVEEVTHENVVKYSKKQLVSAKKNQDIRDIIEVVVGNDELLTIHELERKVQEFLNREVR